jgi:hypothetical protein
MSLSPNMQRAAVEAALRDGESLAKVRENHPDLEDGVKMVEAAQESKQAPKRSGHGSMSLETVKPRTFG